MPSSSFESSLPAAPTNGTPCLSSWNPGASPTNINSALGDPEPKTTWVRVSDSGQRTQPATSAPYSLSDRSVTAATRPATTPSTEGGLPGGAVSRERCAELLDHLRFAAVGTGRIGI